MRNLKAALLLCVVGLCISADPLQAQLALQNPPVKAKWYHKVFKPIRHPLSWWRRPKLSQINALETNPFHRPPAAGTVSRARPNRQSSEQPRAGDLRNLPDLPAGRPDWPTGNGINPVGLYERDRNAAFGRRSAGPGPTAQAQVQQLNRSGRPYSPPPTVPQPSTNLTPDPALRRGGDMHRRAPQASSLESEIAARRLRYEANLREQESLDRILRSGGGPHSFNHFLRDRPSKSPPPSALRDRIQSQTMPQADQTIRRLPSYQPKR